ncbi:MAG TPA: acyltransferase [Micromonosporaceae bacterium]
MRRARQLAESTPASRERVVDLLRAVAIIAVVLGHWLITDIRYDPAGRLTGRSALGDLPWAYPLTWVFQVMPVFFLVGGYANAASLTAYRNRGGDAAGWLQERSARLVRPTTVLLLTLAVCATGASAVGAPADQVRTVVWFASIPLWFLSAYLTVVLLAPLTYRLHRRYGFAVPAVLAVLVAVGDLARFSGVPVVGAANFLFGWLALHQIGYAWRDGRLPPGPRIGLPLLLGGLIAAVLLTGPGPYPVSMIDVAGERPHNMSPPTIALLAVATAQLGLILLLRPGLDRWLRRPGPWSVVVAVNAVVLTVFLWHISAAALLAGALGGLHLLPTPPVGTAFWWLWRIPWLIMLAAVLAVLVAVFGRFEMRPESRKLPLPGPVRAALAAVPRRPWVRATLTVAGYAGAVFGLLTNSLAPKTAADPLGIPPVALIGYLLAAAVLRLLRTAGPRPAPQQPHPQPPSTQEPSTQHSSTQRPPRPSRGQD